MKSCIQGYNIAMHFGGISDIWGGLPRNSSEINTGLSVGNIDVIEKDN